MDGGEAGDDAPPRVVEHHELRVRDEAVVGLVGERGAVGGQLAVGRGNVDGAVWFGARVEDLVSVLVPGLALAGPRQDADPVIKCNDCILLNFLPERENKSMQEM